MRLRLLTLSVVLSLLPRPHTAISQSPAPPSIPQVHATAVAGNPVNLPQDLHGAPGVLVLGFSQASRSQVTDWGRRLARQYAATPAVSFYEIAQLQSVPRPLRGFVARRVAAAVSQPALPHFIILTENEPEWKAAVAFSQPEDAYLLLLDGAGGIRYRAHGPLTDSAFADLRQKIDALLPAPAPR